MVDEKDNGATIVLGFSVPVAGVRWHVGTMCITISTGRCMRFPQENSKGDKRHHAHGLRPRIEGRGKKKPVQRRGHVPDSKTNQNNSNLISRPRVPRASTSVVTDSLLFHPRQKAMADINAIAQQFTDFYYQTFDSNRANLGPLYVRPPPFLSLRFLWLRGL